VQTRLLWCKFKTNMLKPKFHYADFATKSGNLGYTLADADGLPCNYRLLFV